MITELGHFALILALFVAVFQAIVPMVGAHRGDSRWMATSGPSAFIQFVLIFSAFGALTHGYLTSDFSIANVARNSHSLKPILYKISGVWGNHEGSLLLWILILSLFGMCLARFGRNLPASLRARVIAVQGMIASGFLSFILFTSNPFERLYPPPIDGNDLNPLLQDPGLALHPPFLYLGYVGFSIAFAFAIAALIEGRVDPAWGRWVRPWTLAAWICLTLGIALGSWWAYYELGWGGWWFWDPVENASFMPWLAGTALLHSAIVVEKRDTLKAWTILLAIVTFSLSLLGTFLVRSGVLTSVHAFASDPKRGIFVLLLLLIAVGGSLTLFAIRGSELKTQGLFAPISRESGLVINNLLLSAATATVLLGTLYPLFVDVLQVGKISVGAPFFNSTFVPIMAPLVFMMGIGPFLKWKRSDARAVGQRLYVVLFVSLAFGIYGWTLATTEPVWSAIGLLLSAWLFTATLVEFVDKIKLFRTTLSNSWNKARRLPRSTYGMTLAHAGVAIVIAGITGASMWQVEKIQIMEIGDTVNVAGYDFKLMGVSDQQGPNYTGMRGKFEVLKDGKLYTILEPEKRTYTVQGRPTTEAAIHSGLLGDVYAVIADPSETGGWITRLYYKPLILWLWVGALMLALGGLISMRDRRFRLGAPSARKAVTARPATVGQEAS